MKNRRKPWPWGRIMGMIMALVVTLVGVLRGIEPWEILRRSSAAFVIVAAVIGGLLSTLHMLERRPSRLSR